MQLICNSKMRGKQLWKNGISSKDAGHWLESLLKISYLDSNFPICVCSGNKLPNTTKDGA